MKIAILGIRGIPSSYSGLETIIGELAPCLVERGHKVTVYCRRSLFKDRPPMYKGVQLRYLPSIEHKMFSTFSHSLLAMLDAVWKDYDVVFAMNVANGPFGLFAKIFRKPCILNVDGMEWLRPKWNRLAKWYFRFSAKLAKRFWDVLVTDATEMRRLYQVEFGADSVYIAYGANIEYSSCPEILKQYGLEKYGYFLIASRLVPDNNADLIVEAFVKANTDKVLAIAGGADYKGNKIERAFFDELKSLANDKVKFLGHISDQEHIKELHCNCYAYIHGHQYGGINPSLLKALAYGNCVLALNTPFNAEVLNGTEFGVLFEKDVTDLVHKLKYITENSEVPEVYRKKARTRILDRFTWDKIADEYASLFEEVVHRKG